MRVWNPAAATATIEAEPEGQVGVSEQVAKARALNDNARGIDRFGYRVYAKALHEIIDEAGAEPPVCVGLYAKWGSGKTFLINCTKQAFDPGKMYGVEEDLTTHDMRQWFERDIATPEDADAAKDKERMDEMSYCAYTREMTRPRCEQLARVLVGVSFPAPLWAEALVRVATEMFEDICSGKTFEGPARICAAGARSCRTVRTVGLRTSGAPGSHLGRRRCRGCRAAGRQC